MSGVKLHDYGCTLKAYRRDVLSGVRLYGELHRFMPIFASWQGGRITEMVVNHRPRDAAFRNTGLTGFQSGPRPDAREIPDQLSVKAIYVFGGVGLLFFAFGFAASLFSV